MQKWIGPEEGILKRRMGKTGEELGELTAVVSRILIQNIDEIDPSTKKTNRLRLMEEIADVYAQLDCNVKALSLDSNFIETRRAYKTKQMSLWEEHF